MTENSIEIICFIQESLYDGYTNSTDTSQII